MTVMCNYITIIMQRDINNGDKNIISCFVIVEKKTVYL